MDNIITARNVKRCFRLGDGQDFYALKGVDIDIRRGALTILKGRSGSGKTTLLNSLSTLDSPTEGEILFEQESYQGMSESDKEALRRTDIGFIFQSVALIPIMNAYENVDFSLRLAEWDGDKDSRIKKVLSLVGMHERILHMPGQMSGGEQQRIAIARAVAPEPKVIFADEPTGALDTDMGLRVMSLFKNLIAKEGITIVMTTHDPNLMELGDIIYEMEDGELIDRRENI
ncbi:MAG: ABC transporter ATP-binding protein [Lachnospiraceae bacterium]|nr:ABC transporter ATP-binding protein [Lachnospiraceae bacterium]